MSATITLPKSLKTPKFIWVVSHRRKGEKWVFWGWRNTYAEAKKVFCDLTPHWHGVRIRRTAVKVGVSPAELQRRQAVRRKTFFPLDSKRVCQERAILARFLHKTDGFSFRAIRQILNLSGPEDARRLVVKGYRMMGLGPDGQRRLSA